MRYFIWLIFANSYLSRAAAMPAYIPAASVAVLILGLRVVARVSKSKARRPCLPDE
jgi:hypothetical protein